MLTRQTITFVSHFFQKKKTKNPFLYPIHFINSFSLLYNFLSDVKKNLACNEVVCQSFATHFDSALLSELLRCICFTWVMFFEKQLVL